MKKIFLLSLICSIFATISLQAQQDNFTYLTDKRFKSAEDLFGYNFVPGLLEIAEPGQTQQGEQVKISAGSYKFGVTRGNLFVKGEDIDGIHNINQINTTDYGYQMILMNARDPKQQGHLKIIMLKNFVDALVFKANNDAPEMIFLLPEIEKGLNESEKEYFTDKNEIFIEHADEIWGQDIMPFFKVLQPKNVYQRLRKKENVKISFIETEKIIEKGKKRKDEVVLAMNDAPVSEVKEPEAEPEPVVEEPIVEEPEIVEEEEEEDDGFPSYFKVKKKEPEVTEEEILEVEEEAEVEEVIEAVAEEEGNLFADSQELEEAQENKKDKRDKKNKSKEKKVKIETEYEILINDFVYNEDGTQEPTEVVLKVKDWKMREDESAINPHEVFQIEFDTNKGPIYVYLSGSMKITKIDFGPMMFLMRGL